MEFVQRTERLRAMMQDASWDGLVVTNLTNVRYLTGFTGSAGVLLVTEGELLFVSDGRYRDQSAAELQASGVEIRIEIVASDPDLAIAKAALRAGVRSLGLEAQSVTWAAQRRWQSELFTTGDIAATDGVVEALRLIKDAGEAARIRAACAIADEALSQIRPLLGDGPTEIEFGLELDSRMRKLGADDLSFETIVASGPNGAKPHHHPSHRQISEGDLVVIDFGALIDGYHSDMTRTVAVGDVGEERANMLNVVLRSQQAGVEAIHPGVTAAEVDEACRSVIAEAGLADAFLHSTGHGVGLDIHEEPRVSSRSTAILQPGHVVTVEPGVYLPEFGGVRIEDTLLVTEDGCDRLTLAPKDPALLSV